ncbi:fatty acyl-AMP ligase [Streptomyces sp. NPDC088910]|uniref:fatty acyl-AMP ligase n=1 Tax=Streptomyces sp. NPDC088910 TaxID=3365911 RepID=UPI0038096F9F
MSIDLTRQPVAEAVPPYPHPSAPLDLRTLPEVRTLVDALRLRAATRPDDTAFVFLHDGEEPQDPLTYGALDADARRHAAALIAAGLAGRNAVLLYPSGFDFVRALLGCMYAGIAAAPVQVPSRVSGLQRLRGIADDADTHAVLTTAAVARELRERFGDRPELTGLTLIPTDELPEDAAGGADPEQWHGTLPGPGDTALLQYTSGSTGDPKGVMVTHANFMANARETDDLWPCGPGATVVSWLPLFHDMGMLFGIVLPLWAGPTSYLMTPEAFIRRPARWLEAISRFRGTHAAAPGFAYDLCVSAAAEGRIGPGLDLSSWQVAGNGAEPVRWRTIENFAAAFAPARFDPRAMCPGYGLAENTLKATGDRVDREPAALWVSDDALRDGVVRQVDADAPGAVPIVGCGAPEPGTRIRIVDPATLNPLPDGRVGEIWINGPCVAAGYWGRPEASKETFWARTAPAADDSHEYLRTGDLGFLHDGTLYINGRLKDLVIRAGRNHYPQDIELSAETAAPGLRPNCAAAFSVDDGSTEKLVVVVEADGRTLRETGTERLHRLVREAVWDNHRLEADDVLLVRRGTLPKTSSGKVRRRACRQLYTDGSLADAVVRSG